MFHSGNLDQRASALPTALLDSIGTLVIVTDTQGRIVDFNSACEQLTGYSKGEAIACLIWEQFMLPEQMESIKTIYRSVGAGELESYQAIWVTQTGEQLMIRWTHATYRAASGDQYFVSTGVVEGRGSQAEILREGTLQQLLLDISNYFIGSDVDKVDKGINQALQAIAQFTDSDRAYLYQSERETLSCTHSWTAPKLASLEAPLPNMMASNFPHWSELNFVCASSGDLHLEGEFTAYCDRNGTQSVLAVPLPTRGRLGLVGLEVVHVEKQWQAEDINRLQIVADILSNAIQRQQSEQEFQKNYRLLKTVVDTSTDAIFVKDSQGRYQLINKTAADMIGKSVAEIIGRDDSDLLPPEIAAQFQADDREIMDSGTPKIFEDQIISHGEPKFLLTSKNIYCDAQNNILGLVGVSKDITSIKQAQKVLEQANERLEQEVQERTRDLSQANQELQYHLENTPLAVVEWDQHFRIKRWSSKAEAMFGWSSAEVLGKNPSEWQFVYADDLETVNQVMAELSQSDKTYNLSTNRNYTKSGAVVYCEWYNSIFFDKTGKPQSILSLVQDVTTRTQTEAALRQQTKALQKFSANLRHLHRINTTDYQNFDDLFADYLETGCVILGLSTGIISHIAGQSYIIRAVRSNFDFSPGLEFPLQDTYCAQVVEDQKTVTYVHVGKIAQMQDHPVYQNLKLESYIGVPIWVNGKIYGTLNFSSTQVRTNFTLQEREFVELMAQSLGRSIAAYQAETERQLSEQALKESEERLRIFIENTPSAIAMFDNQMRYLAVSKRWLTDYNLKTNIIGRSHYEVFPAPDSWQAIHLRCLAGAIEKCDEVPFPHADGTTDWVRWEVHPWYKRPQEVGGIIMFTEVITERVKVQHQLLQLNQELMRSNSELEQFAYVASHDLREPLRKMQSYTELLAQRCDGKLDAKASKYMASIVNASSRMQELISDLLSYSRVGRGELVVEPTNLNQVLERVLDTLRVSINKNNAEVTVEQLPTVSAHPRQMEQLFQNLIANAIKFRGEAAPVVEVTAKLQDQWVICVADNGIGIDPKYTERVFAIFQRLHGRGKYEGTGIGLAICKKIIERHGGKIWVESEPGKGTAFYFTLKSV